MQVWQRSKPDDVEDFGWRKIVKKHFILPNGVVFDAVTDTWGHDNAAIVSIDTNGKVITAKQFRPGPEAICYEVPGGACDENEDPADAAIRELKEETGYESDNSPIYLGKILRNAYHNDMAHYYLLTECVPGTAQTEETEDIEAEACTMEEMLTHAAQGLVSDSSALLLAKQYMDKHNVRYS